MTSTLVLLGIILAIWLFFGGGRYAVGRSPEGLGGDELEKAFIRYKKGIYKTSSYTHESAFNILRIQIVATLFQIMQRHAHIVLDWEARGGCMDGEIQFESFPTGTCGYVFNKYNRPLSCFPRDMLVVAAFLSYTGGAVRRKDGSTSLMLYEPETSEEIVSYLIENFEDPVAYFLRGVMKKYGVKFYSSVDPQGARGDLVKALESGVGSARIELKQLDSFQELANLENMHKSY